MAAFLAKYGVELLFGLVSAGTLAFCKYLWNRNKELENYKNEDQNRQYREMILDEIEPIIEELGKIEKDLANTKLASEATHQKMYNDLNIVQAKNTKNFELILNSYKFRLIQLCKTHLKDGYITENDFEQLAEMFKLYTGLGGNGQAKDYYEKVMDLPIQDK